MKKLSLSIILFIQCSQAIAFNVVTSLPEYAWVVKELVGSKATVQSLLNGNEDPHFVDATPSFILKTKKADMVIANGMMLEIGWLPKAIQMSGNGNVQVGASGYCDASAGINKLQVISNYTRAMGDVHQVGNPHYSFSAIQMISVVRTIADCLMNKLPEDSELIAKNVVKIENKLKQTANEVKKMYKGLKNKVFMTYHREYIYYFTDFGLTSAGTLEKVPGILPSASHLFEVSKIAKAKHVGLVLASITNPKKYLDKFKEITGIDYVQLPLHLTSDYKDYYTYQKELAKMIISHVKN